MTFSPSDLLPLLTPPPQQAVRYGQGKILAWNPDTFENTIEWRGISLSNVPILGSIGALSFSPGDTVGMLGWAPSNGSLGSWWILGELHIPPLADPIAIESGALIVKGGEGIIVEDAGQILTIDEGDGIYAALGDGVLEWGGLPDSLGGRIRMSESTLRIDTFDGNPMLIESDSILTLTSAQSMHLQSGGFLTLRAGDSGDIISVEDTPLVRFPDLDTTPLSANAVLVGGPGNHQLMVESSSARVKEDVADWTPPVRDVLRLRPRSFRARHEVEADPDTDRRHIGLIAEEVDELGLTALVNYDADGAPQAVDYGRLPVALLEVCRWQQQQIDHLTRRVAELEQAVGVPSPLPAVREPDPSPPLPKRGPGPVAAAPERESEKPTRPSTPPRRPVRRRKT